MRKRDIEWIAHVIISSGIATRTQRKAIARRVSDAWEAVKLHNQLEAQDQPKSLYEMLQDGTKEKESDAK